MATKQTSRSVAQSSKNWDVRLLLQLTNTQKSGSASSNQYPALNILRSSGAKLYQPRCYNWYDGQLRDERLSSDVSVQGKLIEWKLKTPLFKIKHFSQNSPRNLNSKIRSSILSMDDVLLICHSESLLSQQDLLAGCHS